MSDFQVHTKQSAPAAAGPILDAVEGKFGFVPNLIGVLAEAPAAAEAYLALTGAMGKTSFSPAERTVVWLTLNAFHDCRYCMAAHTVIAKSEGVAAEVIDAARDAGEHADPKLEALRRYTLHLVEQRGWAEPAETEAFHAAGFTRQHTLEIITAIAHKTISNYTNHLAETPLDDAFAGEKWAPAPAAV